MRPVTLVLLFVALPFSAGADIIRPGGGAGAPEEPPTVQPARRAFEKGDLDRCRKLLKQVVQKSDELAHADVVFCEWLWNSGQQRQATAVMEAVAKDSPNRMDVRLLFGTVAMQQGRLFDAWTHGELAEKATTPDRWSEKTLTKFQNQCTRLKFQVAARRNEWELAHTLGTSLCQTEPVLADLMLLAEAEFSIGSTKESEAHVREACAAESVKAIPELVMAQFAEVHADKETCEAWLRAGLKIKGERYEVACLEYARWLLRQNRPADLRSVLSSSPLANPKSDDVSFLLALADRMEGRFDEAESVLAKLHQNDPSNFAISNHLALVLIESSDEGKRARAMQVATANARRLPNSPEALSTLGWVHYRLGDLTEARKILTLSTRGGRVSRDTAYYLSRVNHDLGEKQEATSFRDAAMRSRGEFFHSHSLAKSTGN